MPTESPTLHPVLTLDMRQLAELMIREAGISSGLYETSVTFGVSIGVLGGPAADGHFPGVVSLVRSVGLIPSTTQSPIYVDAATVNVAPKVAAKAPAKRRATKPRNA